MVTTPGQLLARSRRRVPRAAVALFLTLTVLVAVRAWVLTPVSVSGVSMEPTVHSGAALVQRWTDPADLDRGQLVVFHDPQGTLSLKRVIGLAGDSVAIRDAVLEVNARPVVEPSVDASHMDGTYFGPVTVPPRTTFGLGDNRGSSIDSRDYGPVELDRLLGTVLVTW